MMEKINLGYKSNVFKKGKLKLILPAKIGSCLNWKEYIILKTIDGIKNSEWVKNGKMRKEPIRGIKTEYYYEGGNVFCYNAQGDLVWQWPEKGVVGITIADEEYVELYKVFEGIQEGLLLDTASPSFLIQVDIETGKELNRWQTK